MKCAKCGNHLRRVSFVFVTHLTLSGKGGSDVWFENFCDGHLRSFTLSNTTTRSGGTGSCRISSDAKTQSPRESYFVQSPSCFSFWRRRRLPTK